MGSCISSSSTRENSKHNSATVISSTGQLRHFSIPIKVSQVILSETTMSSFFVCNSDRLYFNDYIPPMDPEDELEAGQIYFLLPTNQLHYPLAASDMAALAVKASLALHSKTHRRRRTNKSCTSKSSRISPQSDHHDIHSGETIRPNINKAGLGVPATKLKRYSSRRAKMAVRSFTLRLTTIHEGSVPPHFY